MLLGFSVAAYRGNVGAHVDINPELSECCGFVLLERLLYYHSEKPECYLAMLALLVGQPVHSIALVGNFTLDIIWSHVFGLSLSRYCHFYGTKWFSIWNHLCRREKGPRTKMSVQTVRMEKHWFSQWSKLQFSIRSGITRRHMLWSSHTTSLNGSVGDTC